MRFRRSAAILSVMLVVGSATRLNAQTLPAGFSRTDLSTAVPLPTCLLVAPDGRLMIGQKNGAVRIWKESQGLLPTPFCTFTTTPQGETGLIGLALDPEFETNGHLYACYTEPGYGACKLVRITASTANPDVAETGSEIVLRVLSPSSGLHNGGCLRFGPDGKLYVSIGNHADPNTSQSLTTLYGKMLRINRDGTAPEDNPTEFSAVGGATSGDFRAIWAVGLRNPFRFAFHPRTGRMFINDVGDSGMEEIDEGAAGRNYGYPFTEGAFNQTQYPGISHPLHAYFHSIGDAVIGGTFYGPAVSPYPLDYQDDYFFADYRGWIKRMDSTTRDVFDFAVLSQSGHGSPDLAVDPQGRLLYFDHLSNRLSRVECSIPFSPVIIRSPLDQLTCNRGRVEFSIAVAGSFPLNIQWRRNGVLLSDGGRFSGTRSATLRIESPNALDAGIFTCYVKNSLGEAMSEPAILEYIGDAGPFAGNRIQAFVDAALQTASDELSVNCFDFDGDGRVDSADVPGFVNQLTQN